MDFAPVFLVQRFFYAIARFFHHWYVGGSRAIANQFMATIEAVDRAFAIKITLRHFFEPLYKDYSIIGRVMGVIFRTGRVIVGGVLYFVVGILFGVAYLAWVAIPATLLFMIIHG